MDKLMADAFSIGISVGEFWELTPREISNCYDGYQMKLERDYELMADSAIMGRIANSKKSLKRSDLIKSKRKIGKIDSAGIKDRLKSNKESWAKIDAEIESGKRVFKKYGE